MKAADLFCGCGGFRLALENLHVETVFSCDIDENARRTYSENFGEEPAGDITEISTEDVPDFDILTAGFPCQPFSLAGARQGFADEGKGILFFEVVRFIHDKRPKAFLLENVVGLTCLDGGRYMEEILHQLRSLGYSVSWDILNSRNFGVPQNRARWFCVGLLSFALFDFPKGVNTPVRVGDILEEQPGHAKPLPPNLSHLLALHADAGALLGQRVHHESGLFAEGSTAGTYGLQTVMRKNGNFAVYKGKSFDRHADYYSATSAHAIAPTIIAKHPPKLWDLKRHLSEREMARLQGFPDTFKFPCSYAQTARQMGNSVTVPVVQAILKSIIQTI